MAKTIQIRLESAMTDSTHPEAAHAASEFDDDQSPHLDDGAEMLGRLIVYVGIVIVVIGGMAAMVWLR